MKPLNLISNFIFSIMLGELIFLEAFAVHRPLFDQYAVGNVTPEQYETMENQYNQLQNKIVEHNKNIGKATRAMRVVSHTLSFIPSAGGILSKVLLEVHTRAEANVRNTFNNRVNSMMYEMIENDQEELKRISEIEDESERAQALFDQMDAYDLHSEFIKNQDRKSRSVINTFAISRVMLHVKALAENFAEYVDENSKKYAELKESYEKFKNLSEEDKATVSRSIASIKQKGEITDNLLEESRALHNLANDKKTNVENNEIKDTKALIDEDTLATINAYTLKLVKFSKYLQESISIAKNLGLKGKDLQRAQQAAKYFQTGTSFAVGMAQGLSGTNPLGFFQATAALTSLFADSSGPTPEQIRFEAIMNKLNILHNNQIQILKNQKQIYELQTETFKLVQESVRLIHQYQYTNQESFALILGNQTTLLQTIKDWSDLSSELEDCNHFLRSRFYNSMIFCGYSSLLNCYHAVNQSYTNQKNLYNFIPNLPSDGDLLITGQFENYEELTKHFYERENNESYNQCRSGLNTIFRAETHAAFKTISYVDQSGRETLYAKVVEEKYNPLLDYVRDFYWTNEEIQKASFLSLIHPIHQFDLIGSKTFFIKHNPTLTEPFRHIINIEKFLTGLIYAPALQKFTQYILELSPYITIEKWNKSYRAYDLFKMDEVVNALLDDQPKDKTPFLLQKALKLINIAIAQQNLMSGDGVVHLIQNDLFERDKQRALRALRSNFYLQINVLNSYFRNRFKFERNNPHLTYNETFKENLEHYKEFYNHLSKNCKIQQNNQTIDQLSGCNGEFVKRFGQNLKFNKNNIIYLQNNKLIALQLPSPDLIENNQWVHTKSLQGLIELRSKVIRTLFQVTSTETKIPNSPWLQL